MIFHSSIIKAFIAFIADQQQELSTIDNKDKQIYA